MSEPFAELSESKRGKRDFKYDWTVILYYNKNVIDLELLKKIFRDELLQKK